MCSQTAVSLDMDKYTHVHARMHARMHARTLRTHTPTTLSQQAFVPLTFVFV